MKKIIKLIVITSLIFFIVGCNKTETKIENISNDEEGKIGKALELSNNPGSTENFVFEKNGKKYEFKSTDTVKLKRYNKTNEKEIMFLVKIDEHYIIFEEPELDENIDNFISKMEVIQNNEKYNIYKLEYPNGRKNYYIKFEEFFFVYTGLEELQAEYDTALDKILNTGPELLKTITLTNENNTLSSLEEEFVNKEIIDGYRFAFREETSMNYYIELYNDSLKNKVDKNNLRFIFYINEGNVMYMSKIYEAYEFNQDENTDTQKTFAGHKIYKEKNAKGTYTIFYEEGKKMIRIFLKNNEDSIEKVIYLLNEVFEKIN